MQRGIDSQSLMLGTQANADDLMDAAFTMSFDAQMRFCENVLDQVGTDAGLQLGQQLQLAAHGVLGTAMQSAANLEQAITTFVDLVPARASFYNLTMDEAGGMVSVTFNTHTIPDALVPFFTEALLLSFYHCLGFYLGGVVQFNSVELGYPAPEHGAEYQEVLGIPVNFDAPATRLSFARHLLLLPSSEADSFTHQLSVERCRQQIEQRQASADLVTNVEAYLANNPGKLWSAEDLAPLFSMSSRTLLRKLAEKGTSYQSLRDGVLRQQAATYLNSMSVEAAALALGFADTASFRRTFKRWYGTTPSRWLAAR